MPDLNDWDIAAGNNTSASPDGAPENTTTIGNVNDIIRENMAVVARFHEDGNASVATTGAANTYALAAKASYTAYFDGLAASWDCNATNTGASTLNVDTIGAKDIKKYAGGVLVALVADDLISAGKYFAVYDGTQFILLNPSTDNSSVKPAFLAYNSVTDSNVTGTAATGAVTVDFDTEVYDQGGDFVTDTFTAPVTGRYMLTASVQLVGLTPAADIARILLVTSNRTYQSTVAKTNDMPSSISLEISVIADMDATDTALVQVLVTEEASDVVDVEGGSTLVTYFSGILAA